MVDQRRGALLNLGDGFVGVFSDLTEALVAFVDEDMDAAGAGIAESGAARCGGCRRGSLYVATRTQTVKLRTAMSGRSS
jgi:hypothetical protein